MTQAAWTELMRLARRQLSLFTTRQAEMAGVSRGTLCREVDSGRLDRWHRSVYALTGIADSLERRIMAAQLACGPACLVSHATAATLHGLLDVPPPPKIELLLPRSLRRPRAITGVVIHTTLTLPSHHRTTVGPIAVTTVPRTICNLGDYLPAPLLRNVIHDAWRRNLTTPEEIGVCLGCLGSIRGASKVRAVLATTHPHLARARSVAESAAIHALAVRGLPHPQVNFEIRGPDGTLWYVLDLAWTAVLYDVEVDGRRFHRIEPDRGRDRDRDSELTAFGWTIRRVPAATALHEPGRFAREVHDDLRLLGHPDLS